MGQNKMGQTLFRVQSAILKLFENFWGKSSTAMLLCHESLETYYQVAFEGVKLHIWPNSRPQHAWPTSGGFLVASLFRCLRSIRYSKSRKSRCTIHITKMSRNILQAFTTHWHWLIDLIISFRKKKKFFNW